MAQFPIRKIEPKEIGAIAGLIKLSIGEWDYKTTKRELRNIFLKSPYKIYRFVDSYTIHVGGKL